MTTQSKSVLLPFLIIAGLLFTVALGWKFFGADNVETVTQPVISQDNSQPQVKAEPTGSMTAEVEPTQADMYVPPEPMFAETEEERKEIKEMARTNMKMAMRYQTAEQALEALQRFSDADNQEMKKNIIVFMRKAYPNTSIPAKFLD